jgi:hypothetical protein
MKGACDAFNDAMESYRIEDFMSSDGKFCGILQEHGNSGYGWKVP